MTPFRISWQSCNLNGVECRRYGPRDFMSLRRLRPVERISFSVPVVQPEGFTPMPGLLSVKINIAKYLRSEDGHSSFLYYYARQPTDVPASITACLLTVLEASILENLGHLGQVITILIKSDLAFCDTRRAAAVFRTALAKAAKDKDTSRQAHCIAGLLALDLPEGSKPSSAGFPKPRATIASPCRSRCSRRCSITITAASQFLR